MNDITKMKIIGIVITKPLNMVLTIGDKNESYIIPAETYNVVSIEEFNGKKTYITNQWYKEYKRTPLIIVEDIVERYTEL